MSEKKMTRKEALSIAVATCENAEAAAIINKMIKQLDKPRKRAEGPTKARRDNERFAREFADAIVNHGERVTGKWLSEHIKGLPSYSPQKISAIAAVGIEMGILSKTKEGKVVYYDAA